MISLKRNTMVITIVLFIIKNMDNYFFRIIQESNTENSHKNSLQVRKRPV